MKTRLLVLPLLCLACKNDPSGLAGGNADVAGVVRTRSGTPVSEAPIWIRCESAIPLNVRSSAEGRYMVNIAAKVGARSCQFDSPDTVSPARHSARVIEFYPPGEPHPIVEVDLIDI